MKTVPSGMRAEPPAESLWLGRSDTSVYGFLRLYLPFVLLLNTALGFIITAGLIVFVTSTALGARPKLSLPLAVLAPIGIHLIFSQLLRVPLPAGLLPMPW